MVSTNTIFWEVDAQADFMTPKGKLYVPGSERIIPNINRLVEAARQDRVLLISSADAHNPDDPEFREWPPHCLKGTPGADLLPEARSLRMLVIPNQKNFAIPEDLLRYQQLLLQKNTLDVFDNPNTDVLLARLNAKNFTAFDPDVEFILFGVVTEYCVLRAADGLLRRGHRVALVTEAIHAIDPSKGQCVLEDLKSRGARLITTQEALAIVTVAPAASA